MVESSTPGKKNTYVMGDSELELLRLQQQAEIFTYCEGGLFPERESVEGIARVLDLGCGSGDWIIGIARDYPGIEVTGVDVNDRSLEYGRARAQRMGLPNVHFEKMDILQPFTYSEPAFDVVNGRFLQGVLRKELWPEFIKECLRVLRPGGEIRLTEGTLTESNSAAFNTLCSLLARSFYHDRRSFAPAGDANLQSLSIIPALGKLLRAHCRNVQYHSFVIDYASEVASNEAQHLLLTFDALGPYFERLGFISHEEYQNVCAQVTRDLAQEDFWAMGHCTTVWAYYV
ncbi:MAG TPA: class I SAM-dependent methyltransferase [Ktedonobacteraceae bacterium]|jgi:ubiquinone/menaquinone biosynthesis C-methylase UbiE